MRKILVIASLFVLAGAIYSAERFTFTDNAKTVTDAATGLVWHAGNTITVERTWLESVSYCENLILNNDNNWTNGTPNTSGARNENWRLPNINELKSIIDYSSPGTPKINEDYFETGEINYWTSTTVHYNTPYSWTVDFDTGRTFPHLKAEDGYDLRCVSGP